MTNAEAKELILKYNAGQCTTAEQELVQDWYLQFAMDEETSLSESDLEDMKKEIWARMPLNISNNRPRKLWPYLATAASVVMTLSAGIYFYTASQKTGQHLHTAFHSAFEDIRPGKYTATLILGNGKAITLSDVKTGIVIDTKSLTYNDGSQVDSESSGLPAGTQTLTTPAGGTYQVILPDGTKVQLNAASSITFASNFKALSERRVELIGEAYFEVAKNEKQPFVVESKNQLVTVLGTHFNINAYANEPTVKTTLIEGRINVISRKISKILMPGFEALNSGKGIAIRKVDPELAIAWKNNLFLFEDEELGQIMRQIERWYNVEVEFKDDVAHERFGGGLSRFDQVSKVLKSLEATGKVRFSIAGKKIYVSTKN